MAEASDASKKDVRKIMDGRWALVVALALAIGAAGCKRESKSSSTGGGSAGGGELPDTASGSAVIGRGNVVTYNNIAVEVPWRVDDPLSLLKVVDARGLKVTDGKSTLEILGEEKSVVLNGQKYGVAHPGDHVTLKADGKMLINGSERKPDVPTSAPKTLPATSPISAPATVPSSVPATKAAAATSRQAG